ncbi:MAG TPA: tetratricopeptide repeat protein [Gemmatimonadales bacterium]|nr:tetratricopeptide repeat protein [Gemmatimonadales bacterium]
MRCPVLLLMIAAAVFAPAGLAGQQPAGLNRALDLERRGDYAAAAQAYQAVLHGSPADVSALLGLERSLLPLNRSGEIIPSIRSALKAAPRNAAIYGIALRAWAAAGQPDSVRKTAEQWAQLVPADESPYREWGAAELGRQNRAGAQAAYLRGRARLGQPDALAAELAQVALANGDYPAALREWLSAVRKLPGYGGAAVSSLSQAPERLRPELLGFLGSQTDLTANRLEAELRARWGDPSGAFRVILSGLPENRIQAIAALRGLLDQLRPDQTPAGKQTQGRILEALAERSPPSQAARLRLEAAQAYSAAGDRNAARRMLGGLSDDRAVPSAIASDAGATLVDVLISESKLAEAERHLRELRPRLGSDEFDRLRRRLASAWIRAGDLPRADSTIAADSSVEGLALSGRVRLYQGDIKGAVARFRAAGPYTSDRAEATWRTTLLALLQTFEADSNPTLGHALLLLEQGDTAQASSALEQLSSTLPPPQGGAELNLLAGRLLLSTGRSTDAERLFRAAAAPEAPGTAPAAELALAELLIATGRAGEAVGLLEHLILTYPQSALVPQARRKLDEARGAVPRT